MAEIPRSKLSKVPGLPLAKETHTKDLTKLTQSELLEIKEREEKLLTNKSKLRHLPDKGKRIEVYHNKVLAELERRAGVNEAAAMFSELNIVSKGQETLNQIEWNGRLLKHGVEMDADPSEDVLDSDDETDMDPLRIIAQAQMHERRLKVLPAEPTLITAADLEEIKSFNTTQLATAASTDSGLSSESAANLSGNSIEVTAIDAEVVTIDVSDKLANIKPKVQQLLSKSPLKTVSSTRDNGSSTPSVTEIDPDETDPHVRYLVNITELSHPLPHREKFKPYKTTVSNVHDPDKERIRKKHKHWEITAATPPLIQHNGTKMLPLMDSVEIQIKYLSKLKRLQEQQAAARLSAQHQRLQDRKIQLPSNENMQNKTAFTAYRDTGGVNHIEGAQSFNENDEIFDPLDEEKIGGGVTYTVFESN